MKRTLLKIILCPLAVLFCLPQVSFAYSLYLYPKVLVKKDTVYMRDIARIEGESRPGEIGDIIIVKNLKGPYFIPVKELKKRMSGAPLRPEWIYGGGVWLIPLTRTLGPEELLALLRKQLEAKPGGKEYLKNIEFRLEANPESVKVPAEGDLRFRLPSIAAHLRAGRRILSLNLGVEDKYNRFRVLHRYQIPLTILKRMKLLIATRDLYPGDRLVQGDVKVRQTLLDNDQAVYSGPDIVGLRVMSRIRAGEPIKKNAVKRRKTVRRGQTLELVYQSPGIVIKCKSVAQKSGEVGDIIQVRPILPAGRNTGMVRAKIISERSAVLEQAK